MDMERCKLTCKRRKNRNLFSYFSVLRDHRNRECSSVSQFEFCRLKFSSANDIAYCWSFDDHHDGSIWILLDFFRQNLILCPENTKCSLANCFWVKKSITLAYFEQLSERSQPLSISSNDKFPGPLEMIFFLFDPISSKHLHIY